MEDKDQTEGLAPLTPKTETFANQASNMLRVLSNEERIALSLERIAAALERWHPPFPANTTAAQPWGQGQGPMWPQNGCIHGVSRGCWCQSCYRTV